MPHAKNYQNRLMFHGAIQKIKVALFYKPRCTSSSSSCSKVQHATERVALAVVAFYNISF